MTSKEPKLCSDCPLTKTWRDEALQRIRERQIIKTNNFSTLKICIERRQILSELGLHCPYFNYGFPRTLEELGKACSKPPRQKKFRQWKLKDASLKEGVEGAK